jgi:predicted DNA-binding transcriptional regulator YafY
MLETSARLLRLLSLFQSRRYWTGPALAAEMGVTARTVRRDVDKLRSLGYPVDSSSGAEGGYQMGAGAQMPPLLLDDDEAVAVFVGLRQIAGVGEAAVRALGKMEQLLPARLVGRVGALQSVVVTGAASAAVDGKLLALLAGACRDLRGVRFRYTDHGGKISTRRVEPFKLVLAEGRWYLVAWDVDREAWRTFRADRIAGKATTEERFVAREGPADDLRAFVREGYWRSIETCRARVRVFLSAEEAGKRFSGGVFMAISDGECEWAAAASSWDRLALHLGWMGADFALPNGPAELVAAVRQMEARYGRAVSRRAAQRRAPAS